MLYHVVAMAKNRVIGKNNKLPWHFPEDLKHFKRLTTGSTVIMGRKTFESIGKPLPDRENFVLSRTPDLLFPRQVPFAGLGRTKGPAAGAAKPSLRFFPSFEAAVKNIKTENAYLIGGADLFRQTIDKIDGIYLTRIDRDYDGDAFYPEIPDSFDEVDIEALRARDPKIEVVFYQKKEDEKDANPASEKSEPY